MDETIWKKKYLSKTGRWFIGHLYVRWTCRPEEEVLHRLEKSERVCYCKWSLERGTQGNLHYQFLLEVAVPCRRTAVFKDLSMTLGEWIEPCKNVPAAKNYVEKEDTHVEGPWEWERRPERQMGSEPGVPPKKPGTGSLGSIIPNKMYSEKKTMELLLEKKWEEIMMWTKFINENVTN